MYSKTKTLYDCCGVADVMFDVLIQIAAAMPAIRSLSSGNHAF